MNTVSTAELSRLRAQAQETMLDSCKLGTATQDTGGPYATETYSYSSEIACGFNAKGRRETQDGAQTIITDAELRLPHGTNVINLKRVKITKRLGTALSPEEEYAVIGSPRAGVSGLLVNLQRVVGNSNK